MADETTSASTPINQLVVGTNAITTATPEDTRGPSMHNMWCGICQLKCERVADDHFQCSKCERHFDADGNVLQP